MDLPASEGPFDLQASRSGLPVGEAVNFLLRARERFQDERVMPIVEEMIQQRQPDEDMPRPDVMEYYELHDLYRP